jgi:hypothetical protein
VYPRSARGVLSLGAGLLLAGSVQAAVAADPPTDALIAGLQRANVSIVGTVTETRPARRRNSFGDDLIVTTAIVYVNETLHGTGPAWLPIEIDGGTLNGVTMRASDLPLLNRGDRAVILADQLKDGRFVPHGRGQGVLPLQADDRLQDSTLTLDDVRRIARELP